MSQLNPESEIGNSAPGDGFVFSGWLPGGGHRSPKSGWWKQMFTLLDFRPEHQILVMTISMYTSESLNLIFECPGGADFAFRTFGPPRYRYDVQSIIGQIIQTHTK